MPRPSTARTSSPCCASAPWSRRSNKQSGRSSGSVPESVRLGARVLGARLADRGLDVLLLFGRRQHRLHAERFHGKLAQPALGVIVVLVLLVLDLLVGVLQRL